MKLPSISTRRSKQIAQTRSHVRTTRRIVVSALGAWGRSLRAIDNLEGVLALRSIHCPSRYRFGGTLADIPALALAKSRASGATGMDVCCKTPLRATAVMRSASMTIAVTPERASVTP